MKTAVTKRMNTNKTPHNKQEMEKLSSRKKRPKKLEGVGGQEVRQWRAATRKVGNSNLISNGTSNPRILAPRLPDVCEKNVFRFSIFRASASGKQHLFCSNQLLFKTIVSIDFYSY